MNVFFIRLLFLSSFLVSASGFSQVKQLYYDILVNNKALGVLTAKKTTDGLNFKVELKTNINVDFLIKYNVDVETYSKYVNGQLYEAYNKKMANKKVKEESFIKWNGKTYAFNNLDKNFTINSKIYYCTSRLYFEEPVDVKQTLAISTGELVEIKKVAEHSYKIRFGDGHYNIYEYNSDGICKSVRPGNKFVSIQFRLRSN